MRLRNYPYLRFQSGLNRESLCASQCGCGIRSLWTLGTLVCLKVGFGVERAEGQDRCTLNNRH
jgi:hypothetical protein